MYINIKTNTIRKQAIVDTLFEVSLNSFVGMNSVWNKKVFEVLRMGFVLGIREVVNDYDYETNEYFCMYECDRKFRMSRGEVYCKGGSVLYPRPATYQDGWEIKPIDHPDWYFQDLADSQCVAEVYIALNDGTNLSIWKRETDWMPREEMMRKVVPKPFFDKCEELEGIVKPVMSLQVIAGLVALGDIGLSAWSEIEYCLERETCKSILKPVVWWVPV